MYRIRRTANLRLARELHERLLPDDTWVGDDHTFWVVEDNEGLPVGFCSAVYRPGLKYAYMSRAALDKSVRGAGLQRRMIRTRVAWAKRQGATKVITYTLLKNYSSMTNLIRSGFRFDTPEVAWVGDDVHYFKLDL